MGRGEDHLPRFFFLSAANSPTHDRPARHHFTPRAPSSPHPHPLSPLHPGGSFSTIRHIMWKSRIFRYYMSLLYIDATHQLPASHQLAQKPHHSPTPTPTALGSYLGGAPVPPSAILDENSEFSFNALILHVFSANHLDPLSRSNGLFLAVVALTSPFRFGSFDWSF